jgi:hypothetical protein
MEAARSATVNQFHQRAPAWDIGSSILERLGRHPKYPLGQYVEPIPAAADFIVDPTDNRSVTCSTVALHRPYIGLVALSAHVWGIKKCMSAPCIIPELGDMHVTERIVKS